MSCDAPSTTILDTPRRGRGARIELVAWFAVEAARGRASDGGAESPRRERRVPDRVGRLRVRRRGFYLAAGTRPRRTTTVRQPRTSRSESDWAHANDLAWARHNRNGTRRRNVDTENWALDHELRPLREVLAQSDGMNRFGRDVRTRSSDTSRFGVSAGSGYEYGTKSRWKTAT